MKQKRRRGFCRRKRRREGRSCCLLAPLLGLRLSVESIHSHTHNMRGWVGVNQGIQGYFEPISSVITFLCGERLPKLLAVRLRYSPADALVLPTGH